MSSKLTLTLGLPSEFATTLVSLSIALPATCSFEELELVAIGKLRHAPNGCDAALRSCERCGRE